MTSLAHDMLQTHRSFAHRSYLSRMGGLTLGFVMLAGVLHQQQAPFWYWVGPFLHCFAGPQLGGWLARRSPEPRQAERRNLVADHFLGGMWMAVMQFNILPCALTVSLLTMDSLAGGGYRQVGRGLCWHAAGVLLGIVVYGLHWQPEPTMLILLTSLPLMVCQPILISFIARRAINNLKKQSFALRHQSQHDGLSGLYNRSHWEQLVRAEFARFRRHGQPTVLVLADLDHFKRINDAYGHAAGDDAIRFFSASLKRILRETDVCGRYGGEEFGVLLPQTQAASARDVLNRLRRNLHEYPLLEVAVVTASFGVVELNEDIPSVEAWLRLADQMLYRAKHQGRDCVVVLGEDLPGAAAEVQAQPPRPFYSFPTRLTDPQTLAQLMSGLEIAEVPLVLFDPSDRIVLTNPAFVQLFDLQPEALGFADLMRHCYEHKVGARIDTDDIESWVRMADGKRRRQARRNFPVEMCDGRLFRVFQISYGDGWVMNIFFDEASIGLS